MPSNNTNCKLELSFRSTVTKNIDNININSLSSKAFVYGIFEILIITKTKLQYTYLISELHIE